MSLRLDKKKNCCQNERCPGFKGQTRERGRGKIKNRRSLPRHPALGPSGGELRGTEGRETGNRRNGSPESNIGSVRPGGHDRVESASRKETLRGRGGITEKRGS